MKICMEIDGDCKRNPKELIISFTFVYYVTVSVIVLLQLLITKKLFHFLPKSTNDLKILKAITFASIQVIFFNMLGLWESHDNIHINFRILILSFQIISIALLCIMMTIGFCEIRSVRKYEEMSVNDEDEMERGSGLDFHFMKIKFVFIAFGMLYSAVFVVAVSLILSLQDIENSSRNSLISLSPSMDFSRKLTLDDVDISF